MQLIQVTSPCCEKWVSFKFFSTACNNAVTVHFYHCLPEFSKLSCGLVQILLHSCHLSTKMLPLPSTHTPLGPACRTLSFGGASPAKKQCPFGGRAATAATALVLASAASTASAVIDTSFSIIDFRLNDGTIGKFEVEHRTDLPDSNPFTNQSTYNGSIVRFRLDAGVHGLFDVVDTSLVSSTTNSITVGDRNLNFGGDGMAFTYEGLVNSSVGSTELDKFVFNLGTIGTTDLFAGQTIPIAGTAIQDNFASVAGKVVSLTFDGTVYSGQATDYEYKNEHVFSVPEPAEFGAIVGLFALAAVVARRRASGAANVNFAAEAQTEPAPANELV